MKKTFNRIMIWLLMFSTAIAFTFPNINQAIASSSLISLQKVFVTDQLDQEKTSFNFADQIKYQIRYSSQGYNGEAEVYWYVYDANGSKIYDSWNRFNIGNGSVNTASTPVKILPNSPSGNYRFTGTIIWDDLGRTRSASQTVTFSVSNNSSSSSGWSQGSQIGGQLGGLPGKPEIIIPSQGANLPYGDVKIDWQDIAGVDYYYFQVYEGVYQNGKQAIMNTHPTTSYVNITYDKLQKGKSYQYWVWAHNSLGFSQPISGIFHIEKSTGEFRKPEMIYPTDQTSINTVTPKLDWADVNGAQYYYFQIYEGIYADGKQAIIQDWPTSSSYQIPAGKLQFGKKYQLWLWAYNGYQWTEPATMEFEVLDFTQINNFIKIISPIDINRANIGVDEEISLKVRNISNKIIYNFKVDAWIYKMSNNELMEIAGYPRLSFNNNEKNLGPNEEITLKAIYDFSSGFGNKKYQVGEYRIEYQFSALERLSGVQMNLGNKYEDRFIIPEKYQVNIKDYLGNTTLHSKQSLYYSPILTIAGNKEKNEEIQNNWPLRDLPDIGKMSVIIKNTGNNTDTYSIKAAEQLPAGYNIGFRGTEFTDRFLPYEVQKDNISLQPYEEKEIEVYLTIPSNIEKDTVLAIPITIESIQSKTNSYIFYTVVEYNFYRSQVDEYKSKILNDLAQGSYDLFTGDDLNTLFRDPDLGHKAAALIFLATNIIPEDKIFKAGTVVFKVLKGGKFNDGMIDAAKILDDPVIKSIEVNKWNIHNFSLTQQVRNDINELLGDKAASLLNKIDAMDELSQRHLAAIVSSGKYGMLTKRMLLSLEEAKDFKGFKTFLENAARGSSKNNFVAACRIAKTKEELIAKKISLNNVFIDQKVKVKMGSGEELTDSGFDILFMENDGTLVSRELKDLDITLKKYNDKYKIQLEKEKLFLQNGIDSVGPEAIYKEEINSLISQAKSKRVEIWANSYDDAFLKALKKDFGSNNVNYKAVATGLIAYTLLVNEPSRGSSISGDSNVDGENSNLLNLPFEVTAEGSRDIKWTRNSPQIVITDSPSANNGSQKEWLYDLDYARINQLQWKMDLPEKTTIKAKISWETPDGYYGGLTLGGIGLIDENGYFHNFAGISDGGGGRGDFGSLGAVARDYQRNSYYQGEVWKFAPKMTLSNGSADLKLEKDGNHIKIFINKTLMLEQDIKGKIAGLALGTSGHLHFPFGTVKLEELSFDNQNIAIKESISNAQDKSVDTNVNSPTNNSIGKQIQQPLFPSSFGDTPWISANSYHQGQANWYPEISFKFDQLVSKIKLHYLLRNGWYKPTGFKIVDLSSGKELAKRENSIDMYDKTEEIEFSQPSNNFKLVPSNPNGDYVIFYSKDSLVYANNNSVDKVAGSTVKDDLDKMIRNNLLGQSWQEYNDGGKLVWSKTDQGLKIDDSPSAVNNTQKEWLYDLDYARINQLQWKMDLPEKTTVKARISWETTGYGLMIGGIGLIDENGYFHHFVGLNDGGAGGNDLGELGVILRDYQRNSYYQGEVWKTSQKMISPNGSADLKIEKDGNHIKIFINNQFFLEQDIKGKIAGLALGTSGHLHFPFGTFRLENLTIQ